jgi:maleate isomerase
MKSYLNRELHLRRHNAMETPKHGEARQHPGASEPIRLGLIVPSSNVTMERELPAMFAQREIAEPERFSFHSSRVRMRTVTPEELAAMNAQATRATQMLADAAVDVLVYACLVALMAEGPGAHRQAEQQLGAILAAEGRSAPVVSSAGALVDTLHLMGARKIAVVAPYLPALTQRVCDYIAAEGVVVEEARSLSVADNGAVGRLDPQSLLAIADELPRNVDVVVLSACVQMPSLPAIEAAEARLGLPVISSATATAFQSLRQLGLRTRIPGAGHLLSGAFDSTASLIEARRYS